MLFLLPTIGASIGNTIVTSVGVIIDSAIGRAMRKNIKG